MGGKIRGSIPPKPGPSNEVVRVKTTTPQKFLILSRATFGQWIHFYATRSHECTLDRGACERCTWGWPRKWKGYLHAVQLADKARVFVELTPAAFEMVSQVVPEGEDLRGLILSISKTKGGPKGRYMIHVEGVRRDPVQLPEEEDPLPVLRYLWNCKNPSGKHNS